MAEYHLIIPFRLPGMNEAVRVARSNRYQAAEHKRDWEHDLCALIWQQLPGVQITGSVVIEFIWVEPDRRRDLDNVCGYARKLILDALVSTRVLQGDGWRHIAGFSDTFAVDEQQPRVEVTIRAGQERCISEEEKE